VSLVFRRLLNIMTLCNGHTALGDQHTYVTQAYPADESHQLDRLRQVSAVTTCRVLPPRSPSHLLSVDTHNK
jgi:hypothetical protein